MADDLIRVRSGALNGRTEMPKLRHSEIIDGKKLGSELGFHTEEKALYIGTREGNLRLCGAGDEARIKTLEDRLLDITTRLEALENTSE